MTDTLPIGWHHQPFLTFDTETTGTDVDADRIVEAAIGVVQPEINQIQVRRWLIDPGVPIPETASKIHGIYTDQVQADGQPAAQALPQLVQALHVGLVAPMPLVIYNASYDLTLLDRECQRHEIPSLTDLLDGFEPNPIIDPHVIDKHCSKRKGSRTLTATCEFYGVPPAGQAHGAVVDCVMSAYLVPKLVDAYPELAAADPLDLHDRQRTWRRQQMVSLASYFRRSGQLDRAAGVRTEWPLIPPGGGR